MLPEECRADPLAYAVDSISTLPIDMLTAVGAYYFHAIARALVASNARFAVIARSRVIPALLADTGQSPAIVPQHIVPHLNGCPPARNAQVFHQMLI